jgi:hypothetical protein
MLPRVVVARLSAQTETELVVSHIQHARLVCYAMPRCLGLSACLSCPLMSICLSVLCLDCSEAEEEESIYSEEESGSEAADGEDVPATYGGGEV